MTLRVIKNGILDTIQDLGRYGWRNKGVNPNGVMDHTAALLVNLLLANDVNSPVIELHFPAGQFRFEAAAIFALGGANFSAELDGTPIDNWRMHKAGAGQVLRFREKLSGMRSYLSIKGGFRCGQWLGSSSTNLIAAIGGVKGGPLAKDDLVPFNPTFPLSSSWRGARVSTSLIPRYSNFPTIRFTFGAEFDELTPTDQHKLFDSPFTVSVDSNRMGYKLKGPALMRKTANELLSSAVTFGTIQLLHSGQLIVLMSDHQTTGGYPRIGNVIALDLPLLAQLGPGDRLFFKQVSIQHTESLTANFQQELALFRTACHFL